ncbi:hypothetical protein ES703_51706 [subsurface metagenome]
MLDEIDGLVLKSDDEALYNLAHMNFDLMRAVSTLGWSYDLNYEEVRREDKKFERSTRSSKELSQDSDRRRAQSAVTPGGNIAKTWDKLRLTWVPRVMR